LLLCTSHPPLLPIFSVETPPPLPRSKRETEGFSSRQPSHPPSLTQNTRRNATGTPSLITLLAPGVEGICLPPLVFPPVSTQGGLYPPHLVHRRFDTGISPPPLAFPFNARPLSHLVRQMFRRREEGYPFLHSCFPSFQCQEGGLPPLLIYH